MTGGAGLLATAAVVLAVGVSAGQGAPAGKPGPAAPAPPPAATGGEVFRDVAAEVGIDFVHFNGMSGQLYYAEMNGAGGALLDYDGDGDLDVFLQQGTMFGGKPLEKALVPPRHPLPLTHRLYRNDLTVAADGTRTLRFTDVTAKMALPMVGYAMGLATGDVDNDGDTDVLVTNNNGPVRLLRNEVGNRRPWLGLRLVGGEPGRERDMLGARAGLFRKGRPTLWRRAHTDGSYESASDPRVLFGLGDGPPPEVTEIEKVRVVWPSGRVEEFTGVAAGAYTTLREGAGRPAS